jgi:thioredoxin-related protein
MKFSFFTLAILVALQTIPSDSYAQQSRKKAKPDHSKASHDANASGGAGSAVDTNHITWLTIEQVQVAMKKEPRKVLMDVYTDWCGWCKVMDRETFSNKEVIKYLNTNFYAVKLNAEQKEDIHFLGKTYSTPAGERQNNELAIELLRGQMSYPTTVILEENFANPQPIAGYLKVAQLEPILMYLGGNLHKTQKWEEFSKSYVPKWASASPAPGSGGLAVPGH